MSNNREILVLHAGSDELRLVCAVLDRDHVELVEPCSFWSARREKDVSAIEDQTVLDALAAYVSQHGWTGRNVVCLLSGSSVSCQYYDLPPLKGMALRQAVTLKIAQQLHYNIEEAAVAVTRVAKPAAEKSKKSKTKKEQPAGQVRVCAVTAHRQLVQAAVSMAERVGLRLVGLSVAPAALTWLAQDTLNLDSGLSAVLHFDEHASTLAVFDGHAPLVTTELPIGGADLSAALMRPIISGDDVIQLDEAQANALRHAVGIPAPNQGIPDLDITGERLLPLLEPTLQKLSKQLTQWLTFASTSANRAPVKTIRLVGPGVHIPGLAEVVAARTGIECKRLHWLEGLARLAGNAETSKRQNVKTSKRQNAEAGAFPAEGDPGGDKSQNEAIHDRDTGHADPQSAVAGHFPDPDHETQLESADPDGRSALLLEPVNSDAQSATPAGRQASSAESAIRHPPSAIPESALALDARQQLDVSLDAYGVLVDGARHWRKLPDLIPLELRRRERVRRVRRSISLTGPLAAAALVALAVLFDKIEQPLRQRVDHWAPHVTALRELLTISQAAAEDRQNVDHLGRQIERFGQATPLWVGLFKELAALLPEEFRATDIILHAVDGDIRMTLSGKVHAAAEEATHGKAGLPPAPGELGHHGGKNEAAGAGEKQGEAAGALVSNKEKPGKKPVKKGPPGLDEIVEATLLRLQKSPFFREVRLVGLDRDEPSANAAGVVEDPGEVPSTGSLVVELMLAYRRPMPASATAQAPVAPPAAKSPPRA